MFFNVAREKSGRPGRLCDVMTCGHYYLGRSLKFSAQSPTQTFTQLASQKRKSSGATKGDGVKRTTEKMTMTMDATWNRLTRENSLEVCYSSLSESTTLNLNFMATTRPAALLQY